MGLRSSWEAMGRRWKSLVAAAPFGRRGSPPPARLESPVDITSRREGIVVDHPELLAAVCHGLRKEKIVRSVLGRPTADPWGVYREALVGGDEGLEAVRTAAVAHTERFRERGRAAKGRKAPEAQVLKNAVHTFEQCARKAEAGHNSPECTFEHLTVIYGVDLPSRNRHLMEAVPRVRRLLKLMYPELDLDSAVNSGPRSSKEARREVVRARREVARLTKANEQLEESLAEAEAALEKAKAVRESLRARFESHRHRSRAEADSVREEVWREAEASIESARQDRAGEIKRLEFDKRQLQKQLDEVTRERDAFERALFSGDEEGAEDGDDVSGSVAAERLAGTRILLVGGMERQVPPIREHLEAHGVQLLHEDSHAAAGMLDTVHVVVLWTRFLSHSIAEAVKGECRARELPWLYWTRASPGTLLQLLIEEAGEDAAAEWLPRS